MRLMGTSYFPHATCSGVFFLTPTQEKEMRKAVEEEERYQRDYEEGLSYLDRYLMGECF